MALLDEQITPQEKLLDSVNLCYHELSQSHNFPQHSNNPTGRWHYNSADVLLRTIKSLNIISTLSWHLQLRKHITLAEASN
jgi:hypothetical protein